MSGGVESNISHGSAECVCLTSSAWPYEAAGHGAVTSAAALSHVSMAQGYIQQVLGYSAGFGVFCMSVDVVVRSRTCQSGKKS